MPRKKEVDVVVEHTESDERSTQVEETGDQALDELMEEPGAGASADEIDVESPMGEDEAVIKSLRSPSEALAEEGAEVEKSAALEKMYAEEIEAEAGDESDLTPSLSSGGEGGQRPGEEESVEEPVKKVSKKSPKPVHLHGPRKPLHGKKHRDAVKDLDLSVPYTPTEAFELVKKTSYSKFNGTVEVHIKLSVQNQRGVISLPAGTGKERRVMAATLDTIDDLIRDVEAGKINFDVLVATPDAMPKLSKLAKILGPKGLMPNPKSGTVTTDIEKAKQEFAGGRVEFKQDKGGVIHLGLGKVSFATEALLENLNALLAAIPQPKITSIVLASTMGPGVKVKL